MIPTDQLLTVVLVAAAFVARELLAGVIAAVGRDLWTGSKRCIRALRPRDRSRGRSDRQCRDRPREPGSS